MSAFESCKCLFCIFFSFAHHLIPTPVWHKLYQYALSAQRHKDSNVMRPLTDRMNPSTCAAGYSGRYLIHFSLTDKITHLLPTQPRKCKAEVREEWAAVPSISHTLRKMHGGDSPQTRHVANTFLREAGVALHYGVSHYDVSPRSARYCNVERRQTCSLGMHSCPSNSLFNFLFLLHSLSAWRQRLCLSKSIHK